MIDLKPKTGNTGTGDVPPLPMQRKFGGKQNVPIGDQGLMQESGKTPGFSATVDPASMPKQNAGNSAMQSTASAAPDFSKVSSPYADTSNKPVSTGLPTQRYEAQDGTVKEDSLVENRIQGLMSMDNPLMKKSVVNANNLSAQRGLQSSSIATENAVNSIYNYALPIAQQDAQTVSQQNLANQEKRQQLGLEDNRALNQQALNDSQNRFTATENQVNRDFTVELENLRQQNSLGLLSVEQENRLEQLEVGEQIQTRRDELLQGFTQDNMGTELANQLLTIEAQARESMSLQDNQNNFARQMEYSNAVSSAVNFGIEALGNAMMNPEITPDQYAAISRNINAMVQGQITNYQDIYAINPPPVASPNPIDVGGPSGPANPVIPQPTNPYIPPTINTQPAISGGGGLITRGRNPNLVER